MPTRAAHAVDLGSDDGFDASPELDRLRVALLRVARRIRTTSHETITPSQRSVLGTVYAHGPVTIGRVAEIEHIQPPSASKIVSSLEQAGLVERRADSSDRRCSHIVVSRAGADLIDEIRAAGRGWLAQQLAALSADDVDRIAAAVPALERLLDPSTTVTTPPSTAP